LFGFLGKNQKINFTLKNLKKITVGAMDTRV